MARKPAARRPTRVDETFAAPVPASCPDCGGAVTVAGIEPQYQEDLPAVRPVVRRFDVEIGHCSQCQQRVQGRHALQTSDALGAAGAQLGPGVAAVVVELHTELGMPLGKVARFLRTTFGLSVTAGGLAHLLHRTARDAAPAYAALCQQVRESDMVTPDETGWRVGALRHWLWVFRHAGDDRLRHLPRPAAASTTRPRCSAPISTGVLQCGDGWVVYRGFDGAMHQSCVAHLLRALQAFAGRSSR